MPHSCFKCEGTMSLVPKASAGTFQCDECKARSVIVDKSDGEPWRWNLPDPVSLPSSVVRRPKGDGASSGQNAAAAEKIASGAVSTTSMIGELLRVASESLPAGVKIATDDDGKVVIDSGDHYA